MQFTSSRKTTETTTKSCDYADYTMLDGYAWADVQHGRGYWSNPAFGNWPYVIYANGVNRENGVYVIKEYTEHDVKTWVYQANAEGKQEYTHHLEQLKEYYKERA